MNDHIRNTLSDKGIRYSIIFTLTLFLFQVGIVSFQYVKLPPLIPLFNSLSWGNERLTFSFFIFLVPALVLVMCILNIVLGAMYYKKYALISRMLSINLLLGAILSTVALIQILFLVF